MADKDLTADFEETVPVPAGDADAAKIDAMVAVRINLHNATTALGKGPTPAQMQAIEWLETDPDVYGNLPDAVLDAVSVYVENKMTLPPSREFHQVVNMLSRQFDFSQKPSELKPGPDQ